MIAQQPQVAPRMPECSLEEQCQKHGLMNVCKATKSGEFMCNTCIFENDRDDLLFLPQIGKQIQHEFNEHYEELLKKFTEIEKVTPQNIDRTTQEKWKSMIQNETQKIKEIGGQMMEVLRSHPVLVELENTLNDVREYFNQEEKTKRRRYIDEMESYNKNGHFAYVCHNAKTYKEKDEELTKVTERIKNAKEKAEVLVKQLIDFKLNKDFLRGMITREFIKRGIFKPQAANLKMNSAVKPQVATIPVQEKAPVQVQQAQPKEPEQTKPEVVPVQEKVDEFKQAEVKEVEPTSSTTEEKPTVEVQKSSVEIAQPAEEAKVEQAKEDVEMEAKSEEKPTEPQPVEESQEKSATEVSQEKPTEEVTPAQPIEEVAQEKPTEEVTPAQPAEEAKAESGPVAEQKPEEITYECPLSTKETVSYKIKNQNLVRIESSGELKKLYHLQTPFLPKLVQLSHN